MKKTLKILFLVSTSFFIFLQHSVSQTYKFKTYGGEENICDPYVYTVNQDKDGFIWVGTGEGLCRFNGFDFTSVPDTLVKGVVNISFKDENENLWFGLNNGDIFRYNGEKFDKVITDDNISSVVNGFAEFGDHIIAVTQNDGLLVIDEGMSATIEKDVFENVLFSSIAITPDGKLIVGAMDGLSFYGMDLSEMSFALEGRVDELQYIAIQDIEPASTNNEWWIGTDGEGVQKLTLPDNNPENYTIQKLAPETMLAYESVQSLFEDENDQLWVSTFGNGVFRISLQNEPAFINYNKSNGLSNNFIKEVFKDLEGNIWIGSYGSGLELMLNEAFTFYPGYNVTGVAVTNDFIWMAKENVLEGMPNDPQDEKITYTTRNGLPDDKITALFAADDGSLWIGYEGSGIYILKNNSISKFYLANNSLSNTINHITGKNGKMWISTNNGVYIIYPDGSKKNLTTQETLPHNSIAQVYLDSKGRAWVATKTNALYYIENDVVAEQRYSINGPEVEIKCILEDESDGSIWAASYGGGVFHFMGDSVINLTTNTGLKSNFCYSFIQDIKGNIWIGHRFGFSSINHTDRIIDTYGPEDGFTGDCNYNAADEGESGKIYFGTTHGMVRYNPENDEINTTPPFLNITQAYLNDEPIELGRELKLPYGIYKLRIDFIGLNYQAPEKVVYEYMLKGEGFDSEFGQPTASNSVTYPNLRDGNYQFILRSYNKDGVSNEVPVIVEIDIKQPFWKAWWFILLCIFAVVVLVYAIIKYRERKQKQLQEYLETQLELRTKEVVEQKEEIEIKNRDITDSINYAQRIQASILPSMRRLQDNFSGSFVFYQPRDIVSGDFYWFDNVKDNKFVIVCADSTGHGVPGAFMSMIGTTLIKDICMREDVNSPAEILFMLDNELKNTLNQNIDAERSNDGMDIIVCEVDITTNYMRFASAMRPMIIYKDGEEIYLKGSRSSVGGHMHKEDKDFEEQGFQLNKGDIVYMFSDGYPDQFGGPMGKKFKMVRLRNLMKEMYQKPMELQFEMVRNTFNDWKSDEEQVDDVLFMGLKI